MASDQRLPLLESNLVFGEGSPEARVVFIGEAPGLYENLEMRPFVGRAGKLLDELIKKIGWERKDVYITNIVKRRPPENRDPSPEEIASYAPYLDRQIEIINPKIIIPLGRFAMNYFLPNAKISEDQGEIFRLEKRLIVPLYHPAAALRGTSVLGKLTESFTKLPAIVQKYDEFVSTLKEQEPREEDNKKQTTLFKL
ncbi:MAG: uracil-DNA glycosylase [Candidatus Colwellbacteria bacterium]|nr:uracil-DNA glycosylase [Candidatus Colwellbacteria bacterium]